MTQTAGQPDIRPGKGELGHQITDARFTMRSGYVIMHVDGKRYQVQAGERIFADDVWEDGDGGFVRFDGTPIHVRPLPPEKETRGRKPKCQRKQEERA